MKRETELTYETLRQRTEASDQLRELSAAELEGVAGGFVEILIYSAASTYGYYQFLKWADKI